MAGKNDDVRMIMDAMLQDVENKKLMRLQEGLLGQKTKAEEKVMADIVDVGNKKPKEDTVLQAKSDTGVFNKIIKKIQESNVLQQGEGGSKNYSTVDTPLMNIPNFSTNLNKKKDSVSSNIVPLIGRDLKADFEAKQNPNLVDSENLVAKTKKINSKDQTVKNYSQGTPEHMVNEAYKTSNKQNLPTFSRLGINTGNNGYNMDPRISLMNQLIGGNEDNVGASLSELLLSTYLLRRGNKWQK